MAKDDKPLRGFSAVSEQVREQALAATDDYFNLLKKAISSYPSGGMEFGDKLKSYAEKNIAATHEFVKQLSQARDFADVLRIQTELTKSQLTAFGEQTKTLHEVYAKAAADAVNRSKIVTLLFGAAK